MKVKSYAKINLTLDILGKAEKYHQIQTVFQQIGLYDELTFKKSASRKIIFHCDHPAVPHGRKNTIIKAASLLKSAALKKSAKKNITGLQITLKKNIPVSSGLGGGSSDAAATLTAVNKLWRLRLGKKKLALLGAKIGMDVPFFLNGGTALGTHYGEKITKLPSLPKLPMILALSRHTWAQAGTHERSECLLTTVSKTKKMYLKLNPAKIGKNKTRTKSLVTALKNKKFSGITHYFHNDFETTHEVKRSGAEPKIDDLKKMLLRSGATAVHIAGSGPTIYALYKNGRERRQACKKLQGTVDFLWEGTTTQHF